MVAAAVVAGSISCYFSSSGYIPPPIYMLGAFEDRASGRVFTLPRTHGQTKAQKGPTQGHLKTWRALLRDHCNIMSEAALHKYRDL